MELRFLTRREKPAKYCADFETHILYPPEHYFKVPIENRLFFYPRDVVLAVRHGFKPTPHTGQWLSKVWNALQEPQEQEDTKRNEIL
jgi:hypothetical protein